MNQIRKTIYTLNIDNYAPEIMAITMPLMRAYADKIGAIVYEIRNRRWPTAPVTFEKFQVGDLSYVRQDDWAIFIDADCMVHPDMWDVTTRLNKDTVCHWGIDYNGIRWRSNENFLRDGRGISTCNWFTVCSDWTRQALWDHQWITGEMEQNTNDVVSYNFRENILPNIYPMVKELATGHARAEHLIDDYLVSNNIARYGLKVTTVGELAKALPGSVRGDGHLYHEYNIPNEAKVKKMRQILKVWGVRNPAGDTGEV